MHDTTTLQPASRPRIPLLVQMPLGLAAGILVGFLWPAFGESLRPAGIAFVEAIKMVVIPLVFSAVTLGVYKMGSNARSLGRVAFLSFGWFYVATFVAIVVALVLDRIFQPGVGAKLLATSAAPLQSVPPLDWTQFLIDLIPSNIVAAMAGQKILPTLVFAVLFGLALANTPPARARSVTDVLEAVLAAMFRLTGWIVTLAPLAAFAVMAWLFATQGISTLLALLSLIAVLYLGLAIFVLLCLLFLAAIGEKPLAVARQMLEPTLIGFSTRSSEVALPVHIRKLIEMGVPERLVSVVLPLAYSFNLDGAALYIALAVTFLAEAYGVHLDASMLLTVLVTTLIASKGVANVPSASLIALATTLSAIGLPVEAVAIIAGVDAFMDMGRTAVNVFGNTLAVLFVRRFAGPAPEED